MSACWRRAEPSANVFSSWAGRPVGQLFACLVSLAAYSSICSLPKQRPSPRRLSSLVRARLSVTLPQGRLFFSCACWESKEALPPGILDGGVDMPDGSKAGAVEGPGGVYVLNQGGVSIKRNDWRNLWGSLGDVMLILGRFSVQAAPARSTREDEQYV